MRRRLSSDGVLRSVGVPLGVGVVAATVVFVTCVLTGRPPFRTGTWDHGDPKLYLDIARHGYTLFPCDPYPSKWCGNAGWFPAYPWLTRALSGVGLDEAPVALALTWAFVLGTLVLLWTTFLGRRTGAVAVLALLYAAFAPGHIWGYGMYPLSMLAFFSILYLWLLSRERWLAAGLAGAVLVLSYPIGIAAPVAATAWLLVEYRRIPFRDLLSRWARAVAPSILSIGLLFLVQRITVGRWNAYFLVQAKYEHDIRNPIDPTRQAIESLFSSSPAPLSGMNMPHLQTILISLVLLSVIVHLLVRWRERARWELLFVLWAVGTWLISQCTTHQDISRGEATLLPLAVLVAMLPRALAGAIVVAAIVLSIPLEVSFLQDQISLL